MKSLLGPPNHRHEFDHERSERELLDFLQTHVSVSVEQRQRFDHADQLRFFPSCRDTLFYVASNGSVLWRMGGMNSSFTIGPGANYEFQHHVRWTDENVRNQLTVFDNGATSFSFPEVSRMTTCCVFFASSIDTEPICERLKCCSHMLEA